MKKYNIANLRKELGEINAKNNIQSDAAINIIINNAEIYNTLIDKLKAGDDKKLYVLYQMSATIFKQLKDFNIMPSNTGKQPVQPKTLWDDEFSDD